MLKDNITVYFVLTNITLLLVLFPNVFYGPHLTSTNWVSPYKTQWLLPIFLPGLAFHST